MKRTMLFIILTLALVACATNDGCIHVNPSPYATPGGAAVGGAGGDGGSGGSSD